MPSPLLDPRIGVLESPPQRFDNNGNLMRGRRPKWKNKTRVVFNTEAKLLHEFDQAWHRVRGKYGEDRGTVLNQLMTEFIKKNGG